MMAPRSALLIITNRADFAADFLITRLLELGLPYFRLDADVLGSTQLTCRLGHDAASARVQLSGKLLDLSDLGCVWYRRVLRPSALETVAPPFRAFASAELQHLFEGLLNERARWVNPLYATEAAERKLLQLRLAPVCGLRVPPTLVSSDPEELATFAKEGPVICKPASQGILSTGTDHFALHTRVVTVDELRQDVGRSTFPTLLQHRVAKGNDVRVTVIGSRIFPVEIEVPPDAPVDWRAIPERVSYRPCTLPGQVADGCRDLMARLQLVYGAFDFIRTPDDEWFFLEVNPAGEWAWLEVALGLPMRDAFTSLFFEERG